MPLLGILSVASCAHVWSEILGLFGRQGYVMAPSEGWLTTKSTTSRRCQCTETNAFHIAPKSRNPLLVGFLGETKRKPTVSGGEVLILRRIHVESPSCLLSGCPCFWVALNASRKENHHLGCPLKRDTPALHTGCPLAGKDPWMSPRLSRWKIPDLVAPSQLFRSFYCLVVVSI